MILNMHKLNAIVLGSLIAVHLVSHPFLLVSPQSHIAVMNTLRVIFRSDRIEPLLFAGLLVHLGLGLALIVKQGRPQGLWAWAQGLFWLYCIVFLAQHVSAVIHARANLDFDTNIWFAASSVSERPFLLYVAPYYMLAVMAVFTHIAAALHFHGDLRLARALPVIGTLWDMAVVIPMMRIGALPAPCHTYLDRSFGKTHPNG